MLEVARLLSGQRGALRGVAPGLLSATRTALCGSAWYADHAWRELERNGSCTSTWIRPGRGATDFTVFHATEDAADFAEAVVADVTGPAGRARHFSRAGDQSFWASAAERLHVDVAAPSPGFEFGRTTERLFGTSGFPGVAHS